ncbi:hypothetical protein RS82_00751 [Microbacterium trichothecenolyticum]|uniref:Uncharacterized protein n=1 Tax=Microbacterium trichothecenolyticum TaxID=69370 RepID=A0A0M2HJT0_MICTR|nr:hypothetical protein RS82_00751 [Microbacterium trichothecenolyticum]
MLRPAPQQSAAPADARLAGRATTKRPRGRRWIGVPRERF